MTVDAEPAQTAQRWCKFPERTSSLAIYQELKAKVLAQHALRQPRHGSGRVCACLVRVCGWR